MLIFQHHEPKNQLQGEGFQRVCQGRLEFLLRQTGYDSLL